MFDRRAFVLAFLLLTSREVSGQSREVKYEWANQHALRDVPVPQRILVGTDGVAMVEYEMGPSAEPARMQMNHATIPVYSLTPDGDEVRGVWFRVPEGPGHRCAGPVMMPKRMHLGPIPGGGWGWSLEMRLASLSHAVCSPGWSMMVPGSDVVRVAHPIEHYVLGCLGPVDLVEGDGFPPTASPILLRVESRLNKLLSAASNLDACVQLTVDFVDLPDDGDLPPKAITIDQSVARVYNGSSTILVRNLLVNTHSDTGDFDDGDGTFYEQLPPTQNVDSRIGPQPGTVIGVGSFWVPVGLNSLWNSQPDSTTIQFDSDENWFYEDAGGVPQSQCSFEAVLTHEVLHALGFTSNADVQDPANPFPPYNLLTVLDLFRFESNDTGTALSGPEFSGGDPRNVIAPSAAGGNEPVVFVWLNNVPNNRVSMSRGAMTGGPLGDGRMASHYKDDSFGGPTIGIMDPTIPGGAAPFAPFYLSMNDIRILDRIGWNIDSGNSATQVGDILALSSPATGTEPPAMATGVSTTPTLAWVRQTPLPDDLPGVSVYVYRADLGPIEDHLVWSATEILGSSVQVPAGVLQGNTEYAWTVVTFNPWSYNVSLPSTFTTELDCIADVNNDGNLTPADFSAWIAAFNTSAPECDLNADDLCTPADFSAWIANFNAGC